MRHRLFTVKLGHLLALAAAFGATTLVSVGSATVIPGGPSTGKAAAADCFAELKTQGTPTLSTSGKTASKEVDCMDGDPTCDFDGQCNDSCTFQVQICDNQPGVTGCTAPASLSKLTTKIKKGKGNTPTVIPNPTSLTGSACGALVDEVVAVKVSKKGKKKAGVMTISASAKASSGKPASDKDTYILKCLPQTGVCPSCGNGTKDPSEDCDPPGEQGQCSAGSVCNTSCKCETTAACACGTPTPTKLKFTTVVSNATCGHAKDEKGNSAVDLPCSTLWFGGGVVAVSLPNSQPDMGVSFENVTSCSGTVFGVSNTTATDTGSSRTCTQGSGPTKHCIRGEAGTDTHGLCTQDSDCSPAAGGCQPDANCTFGAPLPVPNDAVPVVSTCVVNVVAQDAKGFGDCSSGNVNVSLPLASRLYLGGGDLLPDDPNQPFTLGIQPCPICVDDGSGLKCHGGQNDGLACTPETSNLGAGYPTSGDCPPTNSLFLGILSVPFDLTTGTAQKTATILDGQEHGFCGFCRDADDTLAFQGDPTSANPGPPVPCTSNAGCTSDPIFEGCQQKDPGAFAHQEVSQIVETGAAAGNLADGAQHDATLVSVFCLPPSFNALVDPAAGLPGPGATALPGKMQLVP